MKKVRSDSYTLKFDEMLIKDSNGCLNWTGGTNAATGSLYGYGRLRVDGIKTLAHRYAYERAYGEIPKSESYHGICVLHKCDNPICCNPDHLFLGTHKDNMIDKENKGRGLKGRTWKNPKNSGEKSINSKLTNKLVQEAKILHFFTGVSQSQIARSYNVNSSVLHRAIYGKTWSHLKRISI